MKAPERVVIAGAGVTGLSTAFYLLEKYGIRSTLVDRSGSIAPGASGKAAGFLAKDWNDGTPTEQLTHRSFRLHQQLADKFGATDIQYRRVTCISTQIEKSAPKKKKAVMTATVDWASRKLLRGSDIMGDEETVAQVHPKLLCQHLWQACEQGGCTLVKGKVTGAVANAKGKIESVVLEEGNNISADALLYACGPWNANVMYGIKGHSLVLPTTKVLKQCVFFYSNSFGDCEVFVRPDSTAFCSGFPDDLVKVDEEPGQEKVEPAKASRLREAVRSCSGAMGDESSDMVLGEPIVEQACYQPVTDDFLPIIGPLSRRATGGCDGCFMAGGNNCWGILLGPATGECMADLIATGKTEHVDISKFHPARYRNLKPVVD